MFVVAGCPHCAGLLEDLRRRRVTFEVVDLSEQPERLAELVHLSWDRRVPAVVDHELCSVGFRGGSTPVEPHESGGSPPPQHSKG